MPGYREHFISYFGIDAAKRSMIHGIEGSPCCRPVARLKEGPKMAAVERRQPFGASFPMNHPGYAMVRGGGYSTATG